MKILDLQPDGPVAMADNTWRPAARMPYFAPAEGAVCHVRPCLRIDRQGKNIDGRFAARYTAHWCLAACNTPADLTPRQMTYADDILCHGLWQDMDTFGTAVTINGHTAALPPAAAALDSLARLSRHATVKTGDVLLLPDILYSCPATPGTAVEATGAGGIPILNLRFL